MAFTHRRPLTVCFCEGRAATLSQRPQGKASLLGWNAGTEALCRPASRQPLGAVMSAGGELKIGKQHGTGRAFRRSTAASHPVRQRRAGMASNIFILVPRELDTVNATVTPGIPLSSSGFWVSPTCYTTGFRAYLSPLGSPPVFTKGPKIYRVYALWGRGEAVFSPGVIIDRLQLSCSLLSPV